MALNLRIAFSGRHERILVGGQVAILLLVCAFITFSNFFDWDFFLSFNEVDRRSWLDDHVNRPGSSSDNMLSASSV